MIRRVKRNKVNRIVYENKLKKNHKIQLEIVMTSELFDLTVLKKLAKLNFEFRSLTVALGHTNELHAPIYQQLMDSKQKLLRKFHKKY